MEAEKVRLVRALLGTDGVLSREPALSSGTCAVLAAGSRVRCSSTRSLFKSHK